MAGGATWGMRAALAAVLASGAVVAVPDTTLADFPLPVPVPGNPTAGHVFGGAPTPGAPVPVAPDPLTGEPCPSIAAMNGPAGPAANAAGAPGALFRRVDVRGIADVDNGLKGALPALADFDHDGRVDVVQLRVDGLHVFLNQGCLRFAEHPLHILNPPADAGREGIGLADLNDDGNLDLVVTGGSSNELLMSQAGAWDTFRDEAAALGVLNTGAYERQVQIGDVNGDGRLDIAIGADQIGSTALGIPYQRLYVYDPGPGRFDDAGGTPAVPGFGGAPNCDPAHDRNSPGILLRDLAGDGRLDLVQGYHDDMNTSKNATGSCVTAQRRFGIYSWRNESLDGQTRFAQVPPGSNGLGGNGQMAPNATQTDYDTVSHGLGLPYITAFDAFNSGRLDLLAVGPTDPEWHINSDMVAGKLFCNDGDLRFHDCTQATGLDALNWTYGQWATFWGDPVAPVDLEYSANCVLERLRIPTCAGMPFTAHQFYASSVVWGDFNNDGCVDFVESDRHEDPSNSGWLRDVLFVNDCRGRFRPVSSGVSGLDTNTESMEAADLNGDGLLDLVSGEQPSNSIGPLADAGAAVPLPADRDYTKVYLNSGALGGARNHWAEIRLSGLPQRELLGSEISASTERRFLGRRDYFTADAYKAAHDPTVHYGLGTDRHLSVRVRLPGGRTLRVPSVCIDRVTTIDVSSTTSSRRTTTCESPSPRCLRPC